MGESAASSLSSPGSYSEVKHSDAILILGGVSFGRKTLEYAAERLA